jgi:hypothetical protein
MNKTKVSFFRSIIIGLLAICLFIALCNYKYSASRNELYSVQINASLLTAKKYGIDSLYVKDIINIKWDKVCIVTPYDLPSVIESRCGIKSSFTPPEGHAGLLFISNNIVVAEVVINEVSVGTNIKGAKGVATYNDARLVYYKDTKWSGKTIALVQD